MDSKADASLLGNPATTYFRNKASTASPSDSEHATAAAATAVTEPLVTAAGAAAVAAWQPTLKLASGEVVVIDPKRLESKLQRLIARSGLPAAHFDLPAFVTLLMRTLLPQQTIEQLTTLLAEHAASFASYHPDYAHLGGAILIDALHRTTPPTFSAAVHALAQSRNASTGLPAPQISAGFWTFVQQHAAALDAAICHERDYWYDYFAVCTFQQAYLQHVDGARMVERPQYCFMRVAVALHGNNDHDANNDEPHDHRTPAERLAAVLEMYELLSQRFYTHATPTLAQAGRVTQQLSSCFLVVVKDDSIDGIYETLRDTALTSKRGGGIGLSVHNVRANQAYIASTDGTSNGLGPMLQVFNASSRYVDQGGNKRKGAVAIYVEPWHADIEFLLDMRLNHGKEEHRARDLFSGLWVPDLFMVRIKQDAKWTLFCPLEAPGLWSVWGAAFDVLYQFYEALTDNDQCCGTLTAGHVEWLRTMVVQHPGVQAMLVPGRTIRRRRQMPACVLWEHILTSQAATGVPYLLFKDACNAKSNHRHLGTIQSSNLCTEIIQYTAPNEIAVCNLASIVLPRFVTGMDGSLSPASAATRATFDLPLLHRVVRQVIAHLDRVIDVNHYPTPEARASNRRHRPLGLGVQGLAETFAALQMDYDSPEARLLNRHIFETMYHAALTASCELAQAAGSPYPSYAGSPLSQGLLQPDLWLQDWERRAACQPAGSSIATAMNAAADALRPCTRPCGLWDWAALRAQVKQHGVRNSLLVAPMPTASTSQLNGCTECFEPFGEMMQVRRTLAGEFLLVNRWLVAELSQRKLWNEDMRQQLLKARGLVTHVTGIPADLKQRYRSVWELKVGNLVTMGLERACWIDQGQSENVYLDTPSPDLLRSIHNRKFLAGAKNSTYYVRGRAAANAIAVPSTALVSCTSCSS